MTTDPLEFARKLISLGVPVFVAKADPTRDTGFRLPSGWERTIPSPAALDHYRPGDGLCAVGGQGVDFIDVDPRNGGDVAAFPKPTVLAQVATPGGGVHLYVHSLGVAKTKRDGVDLQAGAPDGTGRGFVFLPGTVRGPNSRNKPQGPYLLASDAFADNWGRKGDAGPFLEWVGAAKAPAVVDNASPWDAFDTGPAGLGSPIPAGEHDAELSRYVASLVAQGRPEAEIRVLAAARAADCVGGDPTRPFGPRDFDRWYRGALKFAPEAAAAVDEVDDEGRRVWAFVDWHAMARNEVEAVEWIVPGLVSTRRGHLVYSESGKGKSLLSAELALAVVRGGEFLDGRCRKGVVLVVDHENDPHGETWDRLKRMGATPEELDNLKVLSFPDIDPADTATGGATVLQAALDVGADLVVFDTATRTIRGEENSNDTWAAWDRHTGAKLRAAGIAFLRLDHSGKDGTRGARGGSNKISDVALAWELVCDDEDTQEFRLICRKNRVLIPEKTIAFRREDSPVLRSVLINSDWSSRAIREDTRIWEALDRLGVPADTGRPKCEMALKAAGVTYHKSHLEDVVRARKAQLNAFSVLPDWAPDTARGGLVLGQGNPDGWAAGEPIASNS